MTMVSEALDLAVRYQQAGEFEQAEQSCREVLEMDPRNPVALHLLGFIANQTGRTDLACDYIGQSLRINPDYAEAHNNLAVIFRAQGKLDDALAGLKQALRSKPDYADAHNNLGIVLLEQGQSEPAAASLRQAIYLNPAYAAAHCNLGTALRALNKLDEAIAHWQQAVRLKPDYTEAHIFLGIAFTEQGRLDQAVDSLNEALSHQPDSVDARINLGNALREQGKIDDAMAQYEQAVRLQPANAIAHKNLGMMRLLTGNFEQGWPEYDWRLKCKESNVPAFSQPLWDGSPLQGRTILLFAEQGLGDTLQFIRYAPLVKERGGNVVLACPESLFPILAGCTGIDRIVSRSSLPEFDVYAPLLSLPRIFGTSAATIPADGPYLVADPDLVNRWQRTLNGLSGFKIGIAWQGSSLYEADRFRSFPLSHFAPLARMEGLRLISLQKGEGSEQLARLAGRIAVTDLGPMDEAAGAFMDTAAVMKNLDLVITSDSAVAHLAGALGVPVWVALSYVPDWRWLRDREDSPWYPTMRLFRQAERGGWSGVFERIARELQKRVPQSAAATTLKPDDFIPQENTTGENSLSPFIAYNRQKTCRHGTMLYNMHDMYIGRSLDLYGEFSEGEVEIFKQVLRPGMMAVEVGANIGAHTVFLAKAVGPTGGVMAFEPQRVAFQTLCANLALNNITNVHCVHAAAGAAPGNLLVPQLDQTQVNNFGGLGLGSYQQGERVPVVTLDSFNLPQCTLLKIDVEGMEQDVLLGAKETIARCLPLMYIENDREDRSAALIRLIDSLGYSMFWHVPPLFNPGNFFGNAENVFGSIVSKNMICCPKVGAHSITGLQKVEVP